MAASPSARASPPLGPPTLADSTRPLTGATWTTAAWFGVDLPGVQLFRCRTSSPNLSLAKLQMPLRPNQRFATPASPMPRVNGFLAVEGPTEPVDLTRSAPRMACWDDACLETPILKTPILDGATVRGTIARRTVFAVQNSPGGPRLPKPSSKNKEARLPPSADLRGGQSGETCVCVMVSPPPSL